MNCINHNKNCKVFCLKCQELICRDCLLSHHKGHDYDLVPDTFPKHQQDIETALGVLVNKMSAMENALTALTAREQDVAKQRDDRISEIRNLVQTIIESVQQNGEQLIAEVGKMVEGKLQLLGLQKHAAEEALVQLKSCKEFVNKGLEVGSPQQILSEKRALIEGMEAVSNQICPDVFQPVEEANITFTQKKVAVAIGKLDYFSFSSPQNVTFSCGNSPPIAGRQVTASFCLHTKLGSPCKGPFSLPLTCHLISPSTSQAVACNTKQTEVGKYSVSFTPSARGIHQVTSRRH